MPATSPKVTEGGFSSGRTGEDMSLGADLPLAEVSPPGAPGTWEAPRSGSARFQNRWMCISSPRVPGERTRLSGNSTRTSINRRKRKGRGFQSSESQGGSCAEGSILITTCLLTSKGMNIASPRPGKRVKTRSAGSRGGEAVEGDTPKLESSLARTSYSVPGSALTGDGDIFVWVTCLLSTGLANSPTMS